MKTIAYISAALLLSLSFAACNGEQELPQPADQPVEITFSLDNYTKVVTTTKSTSTATTRATEVGSAEENNIADLNVYLFDASGANPISYFFSTTSSPAGTTWTPDQGAGTGNIKLNLTQADAGIRQVYIVANYGSALTATSVDDLQGKLRINSTPSWPLTPSTPILMSGNKTHNFITNRVLGVSGDNTNEPVPLVRALAKVELKISLKEEHQSTPTIKEGVNPGPATPDVPQYHYAFLNFESETYLLSPNKKTTNNLDNQTADPVVLKEVTDSRWNAWTTGGNVTSYTTNGEGKVTSMTLVTYLNERVLATPRTFIGLSMPYNGAMPPPEFGPDLTGIYLPQIKRNHWYLYDIEI